MQLSFVTEGGAWLRRSDATEEERGEALRMDAQLLSARYAHFLSLAPRNVSLHVHTSRVVQLGVGGAAAPWWPRLVPDAAPAAAGLAGVGGAAPLRIRARNPSTSHALLLQPVVAGQLEGLYVSFVSFY